MTETDLQKVYKYSVYPRDSKIITNKGFLNSDNGSMGGTHWTCFYVKDKNLFYLGISGGLPDRLFVQQLPKTNHFSWI